MTARSTDAVHPTWLAETLAKDVAAAHAHAGRPLLVGLAGAQGAGKTTLAGNMRHVLQRDHGIAAAVLALDDFYLTRAGRAQLAREVHPLLATRGVPGTHDLPLAHRTLDALLDPARTAPVPLPRFDKAVDDRAPEASWTHAPRPVEVVLFEGWCLGATPEQGAALRTPLNELERDEDGDARFRRHVNAQLDGAYRQLFRRLDRLIFLAAPGMGVVLGWRSEQERALVEARAERASHVMDAAALARFVQHFERLTRHMLATAPSHADVVVRLDVERGVREVHTRVPPAPGA